MRLIPAPLRLLLPPGCGCVLSLLTAALLFLGLPVLVFYTLGLRPVGPRLDGDTLRIRASDGSERVLRLAPSAAEAFDLKADGVADQNGHAVARVVLTETEINSKLREIVAQERRDDPGSPLRSVVVVLHPERATAYLNAHLLGREAGISVRVRFRITADRRLDLHAEQVKLGGLPPVPFGGTIGNWLIGATPVAESLEEELPEEVRDVRVEEGQLVLEVEPSLIIPPGQAAGQ